MGYRTAMQMQFKPKIPSPTLLNLQGSVTLLMLASIDVFTTSLRLVAILSHHTHAIFGIGVPRLGRNVPPAVHNMSRPRYRRYTAASNRCILEYDSNCIGVGGSSQCSGSVVASEGLHREPTMQKLVVPEYWWLVRCSWSLLDERRPVWLKEKRFQFSVDRLVPRRWCLRRLAWH
jgi:hypothetical protein